VHETMFPQQCCLSFRSSGTSCCVMGLPVPDILNGNIRNCKPSDTVSHPKRLEFSCSSSCKCYVHGRRCSSLHLWVPFPITHSTATPGHQVKSLKKRAMNSWMRRSVLYICIVHFVKNIPNDRIPLLAGWHFYPAAYLDIGHNLCSLFPNTQCTLYHIISLVWHCPGCLHLSHKTKYRVQ
jgi:hypothetical protein